MLKSFFSIPRIIALILVMIALLSSGFRGLGVPEGILFLVSAILFFSSKDYANKQFDIFLNSLKLNNIYLLIVLIDALFYLVTFGLGSGISYVLTQKTLFLRENFSLDQQVVTSPASLAQMHSLIRMFFTYFALSLAVFALVSLISYSLFKAIGWSMILNKKFNKQVFKKFLAGNTLWWLIWLFPGFISLFGVKPQFTAVVYIILFILYFHTTTIVHYFITKTLEVKSSIAKAFTLGFGSIHLFIVPYAFALIVYFILYQPFAYAQIYFYTQKSILTLSMLFVLFYLAWFKIYLTRVIEAMKFD